MSTDEIAITLNSRTVLGKQVRALRRDNIIPAVICDHGKESIIVEAPLLDLDRVYQKAGKHHPIDITVGSKKYLAIIKDVDLDPRKNTLRHVVFDSIHQNEKVKTEVPIHFEGDSQAEKAGLMLLRQLEQVEVEATPRNLPDSITVKVDNLAEIGDKITVADLEKTDKFTFVTEAEHPIVSVIETPAQQSEESEAEATEEATEAGESPEEGKVTNQE